MKVVGNIRVNQYLYLRRHKKEQIMKLQISKLLAMAAMTLLLIHIADGSIERISNHGFLPTGIDKRPFGLSNFGISSIILFFVSFGIDIREKKTTKVTTTLLISGGAIIGTTALGVAAMDTKTGLIATFLTVTVLGYGIMGLGILSAIQQRKKIKIV